MSSHDDDEIGYGKPPKESQFQKGKSGNPKGRPKRTRGLSAHLRKALTTKVVVLQNGQQRKVETQEAVLMRLCEKAMKGDTRSIEKLIDLALQSEGTREAAIAERRLKASENDILDRYNAEVLQQNSQASEDKKAEGDCDDLP